jgi:hypothetical protein
MFRNTVELTAEAFAFILAFLEVCPHPLTSSEHRIGAFSEHDILARPPLVGGVYIGLILWCGSFVFFELWEFLELLWGSLRFELIVWFRFDLRGRSLG